MLELKTEVENYTGRKINVDDCRKQIEKDLKNRGVKIDPQHIKMVKNKIVKGDKKNKHKKNFIFMCEVHGIDFDQELCNLDFEIQNIAKKEKDQNPENSPWPVRVTIGLVFCFCAYVLSYVPLPGCETASQVLFAFGIEQCLEGTVEKINENDEKKKEKNKKDLEEFNEFKPVKNDPNWCLKKG